MDDELDPLLAFVKGLDELREKTSAMVAALVADGFTDREAHAMVAGIFASGMGG